MCPSFATFYGERTGERSLQYFDAHHQMSRKSAASSLYFTNANNILLSLRQTGNTVPITFLVGRCHDPLAVTVARLICLGDIETNPGPYHSLPIKINIIKLNSIPKIIITHAHNNKADHKLNQNKNNFNHVAQKQLGNPYMSKQNRRFDTNFSNITKQSDDTN